MIVDFRCLDCSNLDEQLRKIENLQSISPRQCHWGYRRYLPCIVR